MPCFVRWKLLAKRIEIGEYRRIIDRVKGKLQRSMENIREKSGLGLTRGDELKSRGGRIEVGRVSYDGSYWRRE